MEEKTNPLLEATYRFWNSNWYFVAMLVIASVFAVIDNHPLGIIVMLVVTAWFLVFCKDFLASILPTLLICLMVGSKYEDLTVFMPCVYALPLYFFGLVYHLIRWPAKIKLGKGFAGIVLVAFATVVGGIGTVSASDYFNPLSLYYIIGLGPGLVVVYLIFRSQIKLSSGYDLGFRFAKILFITGCFMSIILFAYYLQRWDVFMENKHLLFIRYRNFASTILLVTLPSTFYLAFKKRRFLFSTVIMLFAMFLTESRSAMIFGFIEGIFGGIYLAFYKVLSWKFVVGFFATFGICVGTFGYPILQQLYKNRILIGDFANDNIRIEIYTQGIRDFLAHPILGMGLGNSTNMPLMGDAVKGCAFFYHNIILQAGASMGIVGLIAYGKLAFDRIVLIIKNRNEFTIAMAICYFGMLAISMTNPGELCPLPNAGLMIIMFALLEEINYRQ